MQNKIKKTKAQANVITAILFIIVVLIAIVIIWNVVTRTIEKSSKKVEIESFIVNLEIKEVTLPITGGAEIKVYRKAGKGEIDSLKIVFEKKDGESEVITVEDKNKIPEQLETKLINFFVNELPFNNSEIEKVSLAPTFDEKIGIQVYEPESSIEKNSQGERILEPPQDNSLVSWWMFDENAKDNVGNNDGRFSNNVSRGEGNDVGPSGIINNVLVLDGDGDYVDAGNDSSLSITNNITISAWIKKGEDNADNRQIVSKQDSGFDDGYTLDLASNVELRFTLYFPGTFSLSDTYPGWLSKDIWYHVVATYDRNEAKLYINSELSNTAINNSAIQTNNINVTIGAAPYGGDYFNGSINDVMIFNKALSQDEIKAIYNNQKK